MTNALPPKPTDAELAILRVLWADGPCTVRHVYEKLSNGRALAYTTTLKLMQIMTEKGLTSRDTMGVQHVYRACHSEDDTQRQLVTELIHRAFGGSMSKLVMQALASKKASPKELRAIRRLLAGSNEKG